MPIRIRKIGTSKVLRIPNGIKPKNQYFNVFMGRHGSIIYTPITKNPFKDPKYIKSHKFNGDMTGFVKAGVSNHELRS